LTSRESVVYLRMQNLDKVTRLEVIDAARRRYANWNAAGLEVQFQDDGRTLKIFVPTVGSAFNNDIKQAEQFSESKHFEGFV